VSQVLLTISDLSRLTGRRASEVEAALGKDGPTALPYRALDADESDRIAAEVETVIREHELRKSATNDPTVWERGWGEVADRLKGQPITLDSLRPQYFHGEPTCRLFGKYIRPMDPAFEYNAGISLRLIIFEQFLRGYDTTVEFGCGTGLNLFLLARNMPGMRLIGCDWTTHSSVILAAMARQTGQQIVGQMFNMLEASGWDGGIIDRRTAVLTVHAMEQLGTKWRPFAEYILARRPAFCLHVEPFLELYDHSPFDDRARRYHLKRRYLEGFHPFVMDLARAGRAEILTSRRIAFGGLYHEAYSVLAWRPTG
jgi:hypothetical protein